MRPTAEGQFGPDSRPVDDTARAARTFVPPRPEPVTDDKGETVCPDPRTAVERTGQPTEGNPEQVLLDEALRDEAEAAGLVPAVSKAEVAAAVAADGKRKLTKAQVQRLRLTQQALSLRAQGFSVGEIAEFLQVSPATVTGWFALHRRDMAVMDIDRTLEEIAVPLATENLIHGLIAGDKQYTLETLKGRGRLKRPKEGEDERTRELPVLRIEIKGGSGPTNVLVAPSGQTLEQMAHGGRVVGVESVPVPVPARQLVDSVREGEVVGVESTVKETLP